jgi:asparagine synthase (glutamine-hydrolysing)
MCGIAAIINKDKNTALNSKLIKEMISYISHRGPDAEGVYADEKEGVYLGHKRLSIIDLRDIANQPMEIEGRVIVFNGEIYNYNELRDKYLNEIDFKTTSDTEVLLRLYIKFGIKNTLKVLRGMFAFIIYDRQNGKVIVARDHVGKKPVYVVQDSKKIYIASEIKAFKPLNNGGYIKLNEDIIKDCLCYRFTEELSPYENIKMLKNGHYLEVDLAGGGCAENRYFDFTDLVNEDIFYLNRLKTVKEADDRLEGLLTEAVRKRLVSDAQVAVISSGGLDSSLVTAVACRLTQLKIMHVNVKQMSETRYAELLAKKLNAELFVEDLDLEQIESLIDKAVYHYEYPLVHPNSIGIAMLAKLARRNGVKVLMGGEGADELFGGYGFQRRFYINSRMRQVLGDKIYDKLKKFTKTPGDYKDIKSYEIGMQCSEESRIRARFEKCRQAYHFIKDENERDVYAFQLSVLYDYLQPILLRADKMGMMHSVEIRSPFLDLELLRYVLNLPMRFRMNIFTSKVILKNVARKYLPSVIVNRKKMGFPVPIPEKFKEMDKGHRDRNYVLYSSKILKELKKVS